MYCARLRMRCRRLAASMTCFFMWSGKEAITCHRFNSLLSSIKKSNKNKFGEFFWALYERLFVYSRHRYEYCKFLCSCPCLRRSILAKHNRSPSRRKVDTTQQSAPSKRASGVSAKLQTARGDLKRHGEDGSYDGTITSVENESRARLSRKIH